jgi:hypothetical protein
VRDASAAEALGIATAVVFPDGVAGIAEATRSLTGLDCSAIVSMPVGLFGLERGEIAEATRPHGTQVLAALGLG